MQATQQATQSPRPLPYGYEGPESLRQPVFDALMRVIDPEVAMTIVDVGLIYGVQVTADTLHVRMTMTSAACPVADTIVEEVEYELDRIAPPDLSIKVELQWEPPWTADRMSASGKRLMGW